MPLPLLGLLAGGSALASGINGLVNGRKADKANKQAQDFALQQYRERAPMRLQGMQALGQVEAPIEFGDQFRNTANPFSRATPSTASYGNYGALATTSPENVQNALAGVRPDELAWAQDALTAKRPDGSWVYKSSERNHAQKQIMDKFNTTLGAAGVSPEQFMQQRGIQPLGGYAAEQRKLAQQGRSANPRAMVGMQPLGMGGL